MSQFIYSLQKHGLNWAVIEQQKTGDTKSYAIIWKHELKKKVQEFANDMISKGHYFVNTGFDIPNNYKFK